MFSISREPLDRDQLHSNLVNTQAGAIVVFEGWVRNHNEGKQVSSLEYQVYQELALKEGLKILVEAKEKFNLHHAVCIHREGHLSLGDIAIWVGTTASHRDDAFKATRYIIDEVKHRLPVWKKEHYVHEDPEWVFCRHQHHHVNFKESDYYSKQEKLTDQSGLRNARVLVVGAGGLGCPALLNLATAGIGYIRIVDFDVISISNIHRQFLYAPNLVGEKKVVVAKKRLLELNPFIQVDAVTDFFSPLHLENIDLVLDCTDSMSTKYFIHDACFKFGVPLISAGIYKFEGHIRTFVPGKGCLRCFVTSTPDDSLLGNCNDFGVLGATTSVIGSLQASEAIQLLNQGENATLESTIYYNLKNLSQVKIKNTHIDNCLVCKGDVELEMNDLEVESIGEASHIDIRTLTDEQISKLNFSGDVVLSCHRGIRSKKMVENLRAQGHSRVFSLKGGGSCSH